MPVLKNKSGKLDDPDNYRPIAVSSVSSKILEMIMLSRLQDYLFTSDNQFGFKKRHSPDMAIYVLKDFIESYEKQGSHLFVSFPYALLPPIFHPKLFSRL